jgi:hypothetical protein
MTSGDAEDKASRGPHSASTPQQRADGDAAREEKRLPGDAAGPGSKCPYCGGLLSGNVCVKCGTICGRCGTPYTGDFCPACYGEEEVPRFGAAGGAVSVPHGDIAPSRAELSRIIGHPASLKEHNIARGIHVDGTGKAIHDRALAAVNMLNVSHESQARILEDVEREALATWKKEEGVSLERAVAFAFLKQGRGIGRSVEEIQLALARGGFRVRMEPVQITVAAPDPMKLSLFVNGCERDVRMATSPRVIRVPIYLNDALSTGGGDDDLDCSGEVEIRVGGNCAIIDVRSPYEFRQLDWHAVKVFTGSGRRRCFYLFKTEKQVAIGPDSRTRSASSSLPLNAEAMMKRFQPSKFPVSATLMEAAGCLRAVELRFASLFREMAKNAHGRTPERVAADALYLADQEVFASLPDAKRGLARSVIIRLGLRSGGREGYLGNRGLLLKSEVGYDETKAGKEAEEGEAGRAATA